MNDDNTPTQGGAIGAGGGGANAPYDLLLLLSVQRSVLAMIVHVPHYIFGQYFEVGKNVTEHCPQGYLWCHCPERPNLWLEPGLLNFHAELEVDCPC